MRKKIMALLLAAACALSLPCFAAGAEATSPAEGFYTDVPEGAWYYPYIYQMYELGVFPGGWEFRPGDTVTRMELVRGLYGLHLALGGAEADPSVPVFEDVPAGSEDCAAAVWARESGVTRGRSDTQFDPDGAVTRETVCAFAVQFAAAEGVRLAKVCEGTLFPDAGRVLPYTRSAVAACQMAGILTGQDGRIAPDRELDRAGAATILCRLYQAAARQPQPGEEYVSLEPGAYLDLYKKFEYTFGTPIQKSDPVPLAWFDDAVFVGDSLTVGLQLYNRGALGNAMFLCTQSLSAPSALYAVTAKSLHPTWNGVKMKVEDAVAACGARKVYIMLGINNMRSSVESSTSSLVKLIGLIQEKSPGAAVIVQSVTPLTATSNILSDTMNNPKIERYNATMREYCKQNGWYYLDIASAVKDRSGNFDPSYCGDAQRMGIHFSAAGVAHWSEYIRTHVPEGLK